MKYLNISHKFVLQLSSSPTSVWGMQQAVTINIQNSKYYAFSDTGSVLKRNTVLE